VRFTIQRELDTFAGDASTHSIRQEQIPGIRLRPGYTVLTGAEGCRIYMVAFAACNCDRSHQLAICFHDVIVIFRETDIAPSEKGGEESRFCLFAMPILTVIFKTRDSGGKSRYQISEICCR
jgi:hypothetical protein